MQAHTGCIKKGAPKCNKYVSARMLNLRHNRSVGPHCAIAMASAEMTRARTGNSEIFMLLSHRFALITFNVVIFLVPFLCVVLFVLFIIIIVVIIIVIIIAF